MKIVFVCHAGLTFGLGHLTRTLALIATAQNQNITTTLIIQGQVPKKKRDALAAIPYHIIPAEKSLSEFILLELIPENPEAIVFDIHPSAISEKLTLLFHQLKTHSIKIVGIDSLSNHALCDMGYVPSFCIDPAKFSHCKHPIFYGWDCYLVSQYKTNTPWKPGNKVLVLTGGSDATQLYLTLPTLLDEKCPEPIEIHWIKGPYANAPLLPKHPRLSWIIHDAPDNLNEIMNQSHYAITVFGVSFFELLRHGIPTVVFSPYGSKDNFELEQLKKEKVSVVIDSPTQIVNALHQLLNDHQQAVLLSERAKNKMNHQGTDIFLRRLQSLIHS